MRLTDTSEINSINQKSGFGLAELLIAVVIGGIILAGLASVIKMAMTNSIKVAEQADLNFQTKRLRDQLPVDLKRARTILLQKSDQLVFEMNDPHQGMLMVEYQYDSQNGRIIRDDGITVLTLMNLIDSAEFDYFTQSGAVSSKPIDTYQVEFHATLSKSSLPDRPTETSLNLSVQLRNMRSGS